LARAERGTEIIVVTSDRDVAASAANAGGVAISSPEFETRINEEEMKGALRRDEVPEEDDSAVPDYGTRKKGTARRKSKRERQVQRSLSKL